MAAKVGENSVYRYEPDRPVRPGDTLKETLEALGMTQAELAKRTGRPVPKINDIVQGKRAITPDTALQLERVLGVPASFWNNLERNYQTALARQEERARQKAWTGWLKKFPVTALKARGVLPRSNDPMVVLDHLLNFLGVASPEAWEDYWGSRQAAFRCSPKFEAAPESVASWLRLGELQAQKIHCEPYNKERFKEVLIRVRPLTREPVDDAFRQLVALCAGTGVAVVFVPRLPKVPLSGATRWMSSTKAIIQLSLRYKRDDQVWFTFFHEAAHLLLHPKKKIFLNYNETGYAEEEEANRLASELLIPPASYRDFLDNYRKPISKSAVLQFAEELGIAAGIVVGRLQHDGYIPYRHLNDLKVSLRWAS